MREIRDAVILMAGLGSRLREARAEVPKPLVPIAQRPLISYAIERLAQAGVRTLHAIVGFESERLLAGLTPLVPPEMELRPILNADWEKPNGVSLLAAEKHVSAPFFLTMADHLFEYSLLENLKQQSDLAQLNLAIDRKIDSIVDLADAMKVQTAEGRVVAIGKELADYDAIDTGVFVCPLAIFDYLKAAQRDGNYSLADGVRLMAAEGKVRAIEIGAGWWQDVDTPEMLASAQEYLRAQAANESGERQA